MIHIILLVNKINNKKIIIIKINSNWICIIFLIIFKLVLNMYLYTIKIIQNNQFLNMIRIFLHKKLIK